MPDPIDGFAAYLHPGVGHSEARTVYVRGPEDAPRVVLLHELPGMVPQCVELARCLSDPTRQPTPYQVHMPLLFGAAQSRATTPKQLRYLWCIRKEFSLFSTNRVSPITSWVRSLTAQLSGPGHAKVGVIGMCLTGGLVLGLIDDPTVGAVVASQPSLPLGITPKHRQSVGVPQETLSRAAAVSTTPVLAARYRNDSLWCPRGRLTNLAAAYGAELPEPVADDNQDVTFGPLRVLDVHGRGHALLTLDPSPVALMALNEFLDTHLSQ